MIFRLVGFVRLCLDIISFDFVGLLRFQHFASFLLFCHDVVEQPMMKECQVRVQGVLYYDLSHAPRVGPHMPMNMVPMRTPCEVWPPHITQQDMTQTEAEPFNML